MEKNNKNNEYRESLTRDEYMKLRLAQLEYERKQDCIKRGIPFVKLKTIDLLATLPNSLLDEDNKC